MISHRQILNQLHWRYAAKRFDPQRKISFQDWQVLSESLRLAPSSYGLQPWKFILVQNPELRQKLQAVSRNQAQVTECSHFVVICYRKSLTEADVQKHISNIAITRNVTLDSLSEYQKGTVNSLINGPRSKSIGFWAQRQAYIAMGFLMMNAAHLEIDTCPMEGIETAAYETLLGMQNSEYGVVAAVAIGYRHPEDKYSQTKKVRFSENQVFETK